MSLKISRILHAGYVFECDKTQIAFDPIFENPFSRNCHAFPNVQFDHEQIRGLKLDAVFISHFHDDHCSFESLNFLNRNTPIYVYCIFEELFELIRQLGFKNVHSLQIDSVVKMGSFEIIPRRALDEDVDSLFQVKAAGLNILNVVDSWIDYSTLDKLVQEGPWDMVLWPFQTMREIEVIAPSRSEAASRELPPEWIEQLKALNPKHIVPSSCQFVLEDWSWYNQAFFPITYKQFAKEVGSALPGAQIVRLNPSVSVNLNKHAIEKSSPLSWIKPLGEQDVDYEYNASVKPPPTSEIAKRFDPLTEAQAERVYDYCRSGLLEKYRSMEPPVDEYFEKPRLWRLSVYDHRGEVSQFHYVLNGANIELVQNSDEPLSWTTEIPIAKFYAALELGESLTSMYMRINDITFTPEIEKEIQSADIVEDPLIRCLFNGAFGAYQKAQLKRLRS
ncbi:MBL fold metallo-hydrolase [Bdellovibrio sp. HCB-110]|uniref:MBL fold metallo-hydrolase n=1 Tax=Bdellovibrio sp. HCB-110 TaxID=3391182 RepID=UPI0039B3DFA1